MGESEKMATNLGIRGGLDAIREILGDNGAKILFRNIGLIHIYENPPEYNWEQCMTIPEQASIYSEVENLVGLNGAHGIWRRIGYTTIGYVDKIGHAFDAFKNLPPDEQFNNALHMFVAGSGKGRVVLNDEGLYDLDVFDCIHCKGRKTKRPMCNHYTGHIQYIADLFYGKDVFFAREIMCKALGDDTCYIKAERT